MDRHLVRITSDSLDQTTLTVRAPSTLLSALNLSDGQLENLRFGRSIHPARWLAQEAADRLQSAAGETVCQLSGLLADQLHLEPPQRLTLYRSTPSQIALGPLVGLLTGGAKLTGLLAGKRDLVYCRYARAARETGGLLLFFAPHRLEPANQTITGYLHRCEGAGPCQWHRLTVPLPQVIYDRCFGPQMREAAARLREQVTPLGSLVLNSPIKITKLQAFGALQPYAELRSHLPVTEPLSPESLSRLTEQFDDLYLKPNFLYKGKGVCRLRRKGSQWDLSFREAWGNESDTFTEKAELIERLPALLSPNTPYVVQEGLPLATYLGNRFDLRSLVQRDGTGRWRVSGIVARIAPAGSAITSPRSGGQTAPIHDALAHAFGPEAGQVHAEIERVSLAMAEGIDRSLGLCAEVGLDLGVLQDGTVKLIEANGIPLRVSLDRLADPQVGEQIDRFPIHFCAYLDT